MIFELRPAADQCVRWNQSEVANGDALIVTVPARIPTVCQQEGTALLATGIVIGNPVLNTLTCSAATAVMVLEK